jgi:hypothetical protein
MPSLPIPLISSLVLGFLLLRMWMMDRRNGLLVAFLALCAVQGVVISMAQHYGVAGMRIVQPVMATFIPPIGWVAFQGTAVRGLRPRDAVHLLGPAAAVIALVVKPYALDTLPKLRLGAGDLPGQI